jgi:hypothetical protein
MPYNYNDAPPPRERELIPAGTTVMCALHIRPGGAGEDNMLKVSKDGACEMLDLEFTVVNGEFAKRKVWAYWILSGTTTGHEDAAKTSRGMLRQILESALGIRPDDNSPSARAQREARTLQVFEGMTFMAKIGIEKGKLKNDGTGETWPDKNIIAAIITPDRREWQPVEQPPPFDGGGSTAGAATPSGGSTQSTPPAPPVNKPSWA